MNKYCYKISFPRPLKNKEEEILISFFQKSIAEGKKKTNQMLRNARRIPKISSQQEDLINTMELYVNAQDTYFSLEKKTAKDYIYKMPAFKREILKFRDFKLKMPPIRIGAIKDALERHVFKEMGIEGNVLIYEEEN